MVAVLIGALEHESLLLQPEQAVAEAQPDSEADSLANRASDTGTESAFRAERPPLAKVPTVSVAPMTTASTSVYRVATGAIYPAGLSRTPHRQGVVALRL